MRYMLFAGSDYYPLGGMKDLIGCFATVEDALDRVDEGTDPGHEFSSDYDWYHIYDTVTGDIVDDRE